jgi:large subunit ribosomal protein L18e
MPMAKRTGPTNVHMRTLINKLEKTKSPAWKDVAKKLGSSRRRKVEVNVSSISRHSKKGDTVVVPGIVLAGGDIDKAVTVAAWRFSPTAEEKIKKAKGTIVQIEKLLEKNPKGSKIRIMVG